MNAIKGTASTFFLDAIRTIQCNVWLSMDAWMDGWMDRGIQIGLNKCPLLLGLGHRNKRSTGSIVVTYFVSQLLLLANIICEFVGQQCTFTSGLAKVL